MRIKVEPLPDSQQWYAYISEGYEGLLGAHGATKEWAISYLHKKYLDIKFREQKAKEEAARVKELSEEMEVDW